MYAQLDRITIAKPEPVRTAASTRRTWSIKQNISRFLNWFGSGEVDIQSAKTRFANGSNIMLLNGQVVALPSCREVTGAEQFTM